MIDKKIVFVSGCSSGIGLCCALGLHRRGYHVIASVREQADKQMLIEQGINDIVFLDLSDSYSVREAIKIIKTISQGRLYAVFNNAAYGQPGAVEDLTRDVLTNQFEVNFFGTHELTVGLLPELLEQKSARIIQNSSVLGFAAMPMRGAYNASKFALEGLSDTLRLELYDTNVNVSIIEPGPILSQFRARGLKELNENINIGNSRHSKSYKLAMTRLENEGPSSKFTLPPEAVFKKLLHALESDKPKTRYYVTFPTHLFAILRRVFPTILLDKILRTFN